MRRAQRCSVIHVRELYNDGGQRRNGHNVVKRSTFASSTTMAENNVMPIALQNDLCPRTLQWWQTATWWPQCCRTIRVHKLYNNDMWEFFFFQLEMEIFTARDFKRCCCKWAHIRANSDHAHKHCICIHSTEGQIYDPGVKLVAYA
jgi:hypothetical protein